MKALYYRELGGKKVECRLCPHHCKLKPDQYGICGVRKNIDGELQTLVYGKAVASHMDPIEKKPLFHVYPGSLAFSLATVGCNFKCKFCQNCDISQMPRERNDLIIGDLLSPENVIHTAKKRLCKTVALTYTEPTIFYEYALDIAKLANEQKLGAVWISNGYIDPEPLTDIAPYLVAANIDLKGWDKGFYRSIVGGDLDKVLDTLRLLKKLDVWLEVTTLLVPGYVDNEEAIIDMAKFIANELGPETPWHLSRFHPQYLMQDVPPTPISVLRRAREIGLREGLHYVYSGNVPGDQGEHTFCKQCGNVLIERWGYNIIDNKLVDGACPHCGTVIDGVGMGSV